MNRTFPLTIRHIIYQSDYKAEVVATIGARKYNLIVDMYTCLEAMRLFDKKQKREGWFLLWEHPQTVILHKQAWLSLREYNTAKSYQLELDLELAV